MWLHVFFQCHETQTVTSSRNLLLPAKPTRKICGGGGLILFSSVSSVFKCSSVHSRSANYFYVWRTAKNLKPMDNIFFFWGLSWVWTQYLCSTCILFINFRPVPTAACLPPPYCHLIATSILLQKDSTHILPHVFIHQCTNHRFLGSPQQSPGGDERDEDGDHRRGPSGRGGETRDGEGRRRASTSSNKSGWFPTWPDNSWRKLTTLQKFFPEEIVPKVIPKEYYS